MIRRRHPSLVALHEGPEEKYEPRAPHPDLVALCHELRGGPAKPMTMPVTQRIAAVWRGPGTWEERYLGAMRQANAEGPTVWLDITSAVVKQQELEEFLHRKRAAELDHGIAHASTEAIQQARIRSKAREFRDYWRERLSPFRKTDSGDNDFT